MIDHCKVPQETDNGPVPENELEQVCATLGEILSDGADLHRCLAARASGSIGAPASVEPLIAALLDEDEDVRTDAAEALSQIADPRSSRQLRDNLLGDPCSDVKLAAIEALVKLHDEQIIPWLRRIVRGRDEDIVWNDEEFLVSGWDDWVDIQLKAIKALADLNVVEAVPDIVAAVRDEDVEDVAEAAFKALARLGIQGTEALASFLNDDSVRMRRRAAAALAAVDSEYAREPLAQALRDPSTQVRSAAMRALAVRDPSDDRLSGLLGDPDAAIRSQAAQLCAERHPQRVAAMIEDPSASVQTAALTALRRVDGFAADEALIEVLQAKLEDASGEVAAAAARALAAAVPEIAREQLAMLAADVAGRDETRLGAIKGLTAIGDERSIAALIDQVGDKERSIRLETISALAKLARTNAAWPNAAGDALLSALRGEHGSRRQDGAGDQMPPENAGPDADVQDTVSENDGDTGVFPTSTLDSILEDTPEVRTLVGLPDEGVELSRVDMERLAVANQIKGRRRVSPTPDVVPEEDIRRFAARVLGDLPHESVVRELTAALEDPDTELRLAAADSLSRIGAYPDPCSEAVTDALIEAAATENRDLKILLIRALAAGKGEAVPAFLAEQTRNDDSFVRAEAIRALIKMDRAGPEIGLLIDDPDPSVRECSAQAVARSGADGTVRRLVEFAFAFEGYHSRFAARLLRDLDAPRANTLLVDVLHDPERKRVWSLAIEALEEVNRSHLDRAIRGLDQQLPE